MDSDPRYPLVPGAKNPEMGRHIKVDSLTWIMADVLPTQHQTENQVYLLSSDGRAYQWWEGNWRYFQGGGSIGPIDASMVAYTNGRYPAIATVKDALDLIFFVPLACTGFTNNVGTVEIGTVVTAVTLNWGYNKGVTAQGIAPGYPSLATALRSLSLTSQNITTDLTYTLSGTDGSSSVNASTSIAFRHKRRWGVSAQETPDQALLDGFSSELASNRNQTKTFSPGGAYIYFAWPVSFGLSPTFTINSFPVTGWVTTTLSYMNAQGYSSSFIVFRSQYPQGGVGITVVVT
jgi:hypothetical protein